MGLKTFTQFSFHCDGDGCSKVLTHGKPDEDGCYETGFFEGNFYEDTFYDKGWSLINDSGDIMIMCPKCNKNKVPSLGEYVNDRINQGDL